MSSSKNKIVLKKLKDTNNVWHSDSTLVFKSSKDKVVIGRYLEKEIIPLDDLCLELCSKWKFKYDKTLVEEENENEEEENENEEDENEVIVKKQEVTEEVDQEEVDQEEVEQEEETTEEVEKEEETTEEVEESKEEETIEEVEEKTFEKEDIKKLKNINDKQTYLTDITSDFSKKIYIYFDSVNQKYNEELLNLKNDMTAKDKIHNKLLKEHESVKEELKNLKNKFEGIKQLFSL